MAGKTALSYLQNILQDGWHEDIEGRVESVPKPAIVMASTGYNTRFSEYDGDLVVVKDGGPQGLTPKGSGFTHRGVESLATIECRTAVSRGRLEGIRTEDNEPERYGGLRGEVQRVLDTVRKGDKEFDWIDGYEWNDNSEDVGFQFWRGNWEVRLNQVAENIDPEP